MNKPLKDYRTWCLLSALIAMLVLFMHPSKQQKTPTYNYTLRSTKPSPEGEGWVRGNQNKEKSLFESPHPSLLPEGEGAHPS
jgi:hypothetical protein